jgi:hypothetical protein
MGPPWLKLSAISGQQRTLPVLINAYICHEIHNHFLVLWKKPAFGFFFKAES